MSKNYFLGDFSLLNRVNIQCEAIIQTDQEFFLIVCWLLAVKNDFHWLKLNPF